MANIDETKQAMHVRPTYETPQMTVAVIEAVDVIRTSSNPSDTEVEPISG